MVLNLRDGRDGVVGSVDSSEARQLVVHMSRGAHIFMLLLHSSVPMRLVSHVYGED